MLDMKKRIKNNVEKTEKKISSYNESLQLDFVKHDNYLKGYYTGKIRELEGVNHEYKILLLLLDEEV